jgi:hypothetical protein
MDRFYRDDQCAIPFTLDEYTFDSVQRSSSNAHSLPHIQERTKTVAGSASKNLADARDLVLRNGNAFATNPDET